MALCNQHQLGRHMLLIMPQLTLLKHQFPNLFIYVRKFYCSTKCHHTSPETVSEAQEARTSFN